MRTSKAVSFIVGLGLIAGATSAAAPDQAKWKGTIVKEGEVTVVRSPKEPVYKKQVLELKEDFVLGGEAAEGEYVFSHPYAMAVDAGENLYVVDAGERNLKVFDKSGKYARTIGRAGQGPGEFQFPTGVCTVGGSQELVVFDLQRISVFSFGGAFLRQFPIKGLSAGLQVDSQGNLFIATTAVPSGQLTLKAYTPDMSRELAVVLTCTETQGPDPFKPRALWILDQAGHVVFGDSKTYEIKILDSRGRVLKKVSRDYDPVRVTQEERDDLAGRTSRVLGPEAAKSMVFSTHHSAYRSLFVADVGRLFVETWERTSDGKQDVYDIFDEEGRYIARAMLAPHPDFLNPLPRFIRNGKLYTIEPDPKGYEVVKRYTVNWNIQDK
jgi:hypothetical protein